MRVYFDNTVVSLEARRSAWEVSALSAIELLRQLESSGHIRILTSRFTWHEQSQSTRPEVRSKLEAARPNTPLVENDLVFAGSRRSQVGEGG